MATAEKRSTTTASRQAASSSHFTKSLSAEDVKATVREFARCEWFRGIAMLDDYPICSKPLTKREAAMISRLIRKSREQAAEKELQAQRRRARLGQSVLKLPEDDRIQLIELLIDSLVRTPLPVAVTQRAH